MHLVPTQTVNSGSLNAEPPHRIPSLPTVLQVSPNERIHGVLGLVMPRQEKRDRSLTLA